MGNVAENNTGSLKIGISLTIGSRSHIQHILEITSVLTQRGHTVYYLSLDHFKHFGDNYNVTYYNIGNANPKKLGYKLKPFTKGMRFFSGWSNIEEYFYDVYTVSFPHYEKFYQNIKPDLMICDFAASSCIDSAAKYSIPLIFGHQALDMVEKMPPYYTVHNLLGPTTIESLSVWEKLKQSIFGPLDMMNDFLPISNALKKARKIHGIPELRDITEFKHMGLAIANSFFGLENPRPLSPRVIPIGPIFSSNILGLNEDFQSFLENRSKVLYIAFGSLIKLNNELSASILGYIHQLFDEELLDGVVWAGVKNTKLEDFPESYSVKGVSYSTKDILKGNDKRFKLVTWAPQQSILNHPSTKLFITHGGLDSIYESMYSGTPMLSIPHFSDQPRNSMLITERGIGDYIEWPIDTEEIIIRKFFNLLNPNNVKLQSKLRQYQVISKFSSSRKVMAADLVESYAHSAQHCRFISKPKAFESPCEVKPYLPLDQTMSAFKAYKIDVYLYAASLLIAVIYLLATIYNHFILLLAHKKIKIKIS